MWYRLSFKCLADLVGVNGFVVAVDPDTRRLALAEARYKASNLRFIQGCAENFPVSEYDVIFCNHVLHWVRDRPKAFARMANSLKPGGLLACSYVIEHGNQADEYDFLSNSSRRTLSENLSDPLQENECDILTDVFGFHQLHKSQHYCVHNFKDEKEYIKFFLTHWKIDKILEKDVNIEVITNKKRRDGELYFKYLIMTIVMQKN